MLDLLQHIMLHNHDKFYFYIFDNKILYVYYQSKMKNLMYLLKISFENFNFI